VARVFITGSSDGLGLIAARLLIGQGHEVVLHGRNEGRSRDALAAAAGAGGVVSGDPLRRLERFWIRAADLVQRPPRVAASSPPAQPLFA
jgi:NAD(P)-dependent dehydrogenase (short-subunit alcohol dehydrogenase family)